jgi:hypothetical protein
MRREQMVSRDEATIPAIFIPYKTHNNKNTDLTESNLHSKPLPACLPMVTPKMANASCRHEHVIELELP